MTVQELLDYLDGAGLAITDYDEIGEHLLQQGIALFDEVSVRSPGGANANTGNRVPAKVVVPFSS